MNTAHGLVAARLRLGERLARRGNAQNAASRGDDVVVGDARTGKVIRELRAPAARNGGENGVALHLVERPAPKPTPPSPDPKKSASEPAANGRRTIVNIQLRTSPSARR